jgi:hypothetical protein
MKKGVRSASIGQRYGSVDPDPDPHQNDTDPQHWLGRIGMRKRGSNMNNAPNRLLTGQLTACKADNLGIPKNK